MDFKIIEEHNLARLREKKSAGAICSVHVNGEKVYENYFGYSDIEARKPMQADSIFRLASMSKPVTGIAVMQLVEQGKIGLFDDISKFIPELKDFVVGKFDENRKIVPAAKARRGINIFQLLNHCSGLGQAEIGYSYMDTNPRKYFPQPGEVLSDVAPRYGDYLLDCNPGEAFGYGAHIPYDLLGRVVEIASGMNFNDYIQKNICAPLGMTDTTYHLSAEQRKRVVKMYYAPGIDGKDGELFRSGPADNSNFGNYPESYEGGSCCLMGTCRDYEKIAEMFAQGGTLNGNRILSEDTVRLMSTPLTHPTTLCYNIGQVWGLSMRVVNTTDPNGPLFPGTFGWSGAYGTHFIISPAQHLSAVYFSNLSNAGGSGAPASLEFEADVTNVLRKNL